jgi:catalase
MQAKANMGGFVSYAEKIDAQKVRARSASFFDHFSQAALFWNSQSDPEKEHLVQALRFELGKVEVIAIRERMLAMLAHVDASMASRVARGLGLSVPAKLDKPLNMHIPADGDVEQFQPKPANKSIGHSVALSMANTVKDSIKTRKIAILAADGFDAVAFSSMKQALTAAGAQAKVVAPRLGALRSANGDEVQIDFSLFTASSVIFDAVYVPGGEQSVTALKAEANALHFINEAYKHCKTIAAIGAGIDLLRASHLGAEEGVIVGRDEESRELAAEFIRALARHRHWSREMKAQVPA